jgi:hypothetical protein
MHSTSKRPSHSERRSGLPFMRWPLQQLQWLPVLAPSVLSPALFVSALLLVGERRRRRRSQRETEMVARRFVLVIHA